MSRRKAEQIYEGEWTKWEKNDRLQCCDCLLIHDLKWRVRNGQLELKMFRNNRSTAAYRRVHGIELSNGTKRDIGVKHRKFLSNGRRG